MIRVWVARLGLNLAEWQQVAVEADLAKADDNAIPVE